VARPQHKAVHRPCPYGKTNWQDCDTAHDHRFGQCRAMVADKKGPHQCSRWAGGDEGLCGQHLVAEIEASIRSKHIAIAEAELSYRIDAYIAYTAEHPSIWDSPSPPRGVAPGLGVEPSRVVLETTPPPEAPRQRKGPHRLTSLD
jgi:hypothetical protein